MLASRRRRADASGHALRPVPTRRVPLLWLLFGGTAAVMVAAAAVLAFSPAAIHSATSTDELLGLAAGLAVMLLADLLFLRGALAPLHRLTALMGSVELLRGGRRIGDLGRPAREIGQLAHAFDEMLGRLEREHGDATRRAIAAQESERVRVARELHDELGQPLTAIALRAEAAARAEEDPRAVLAEIAQGLHGTVNEVRRIARELRPEALDDLGLVNALIALCARVGERGGPWIERAFAPELPPLRAGADLVIYRVAQEALANAVRHARARRVELALDHDRAHVTLTVRDDGRGLPEPLVEGIGITGMRERARLIDARLEVAAHAPTGGTEIRLIVPATMRP